MLDLIYIGLTVVYFGVMAAFIYICERLMAGATGRSGARAMTARYSNDERSDSGA